jgi:GTP-binding protein
MDLFYLLRELFFHLQSILLYGQLHQFHEYEIEIYFQDLHLWKHLLQDLRYQRIRSLHFSYKRYLANKLRETFNLEGSPILLYPRAKGERDNEQEENGAES